MAQALDEVSLRRLRCHICPCNSNLGAPHRGCEAAAASMCMKSLTAAGVMHMYDTSNSNSGDVCASPTAAGVMHVYEISNSSSSDTSV